VTEVDKGCQSVTKPLSNNNLAKINAENGIRSRNEIEKKNR